MMVRDRKQDDALVWEFDVPLLSNRYMLGGFATAIFGGAAMCAALVGMMLALQGAWQAAWGVVLLFLGISSALFAVGLVIMLLFFRNRIRTRFSVDGEGVRSQTLDRAARFSSRASTAAGALLGSGATAGAGMLAWVQETQVVRWRGAFRAVPEPGTHSIAFRNGWRTLLRIYCPPETFEETVARVRHHMDRHGTAGRCAGAWPLRGPLARTALVIAAIPPIVAACDVYGVDLFLPIFVLCFGVATI